MSDQFSFPEQPAPNGPGSPSNSVPPQAGPQTPPAGGYQTPPRSSQVPPHGFPTNNSYQQPRAAIASFFDSIRRVGVVRSQERWAGGVLGGLALRLGIDATLVRVLFLLFIFFSSLFSFGVPVLLYGLAWGFLPEEIDGRIHVEEALNGRFHAGLAGAVLFVFLGMCDFTPNFAHGYWVNSDVAEFFTVVAVIAGVIAFCFWYGSRSSRQKPRMQQPAAQPVWMQAAAQSVWMQAGAQPGAAPTGQPGMPQGAPQQMPQGMPAQGFQPTPPGRPLPPRPRVLGPTRQVYLLVFGLALLILAGAFYLVKNTDQGVLGTQYMAGGAIFVLFGLALMYSGARGRRGGWLTALSVCGAIFAVPALVFGSTAPSSVMGIGSDGEYATGRVVLDHNSDGVDMGVGDVTLDLSAMPADAKPHDININMAGGTVNIKTRSGQSVAVDIDMGAGGINANTVARWQTSDGSMSMIDPQDDSCAYDDCNYHVDGSAATPYNFSQTGFAIGDVKLLSPAAEKTSEPTVTVNISMGVGAVGLNEADSSVVWYGVQEDSAWIVDTWGKTGLDQSHTSLPVPGMKHAAITTAQANQCVAQAMAQDDDDDVFSDYDYSDIPDMTVKERDSYHQCVSQVLATQAKSNTEEK